MRTKTGVSTASAKPLQTCKIWSMALKVDGRLQRKHTVERQIPKMKILSVEGEVQSSVDKGENWLTKLSPKMKCSIS